jgi:hypothetical protein
MFRLLEVQMNVDLLETWIGPIFASYMTILSGKAWGIPHISFWSKKTKEIKCLQFCPNMLHATTAPPDLALFEYTWFPLISLGCGIELGGGLGACAALWCLVVALFCLDQIFTCPDNVKFSHWYLTLWLGSWIIHYPDQVINALLFLSAIVFVDNLKSVRWHYGIGILL